MPEIFSYSFMIRAFLAGMLIAVVAPVMGTFLVAKRYSLMADSLAHVSLAGVALGIFLGINPLISSVIVAMITAVVIEKLRTVRGVAGEVSLAMFLSGGLAVAIVLIGVSKGFSVDLFAYLFGSITTVQFVDLWIMLGLSIVVLGVIFTNYRQFLSLAFDEEAAQVSGVKTEQLNLVFMLLTALTVSLAMRVVGVLLIGALMVIPVVTATQLRLSFGRTLLAAVGLSLCAVLLGLVISFYANLASGGTIVVCALLLFFGVTLLFRQRSSRVSA